MIKLNLPKGDGPLEQIEECLRVIKEMENLSQKSKKISLDFSEIQWILPCSALLLGGKIDEIKNKGIKINYIVPENENVKKYFLDIGFPFGTTKQGDTYYPINHFNNKENINEKINMLVESMSKKIPEEFGDSIPYLLAELTDNIEQHSQFTHASIMAQYFPKKNYIDIGILDNGLSIPCVFEKNKISFSKDYEAIDKALKGTTTKKEDGLRGYGLQSSKKIVRDLIDGELHIISRKGAIIFKPDFFSQKCELAKNSLGGTLIYMRLNTPSKSLNIYPHLE